MVLNTPIFFLGGVLAKYHCFSATLSSSVNCIRKRIVRHFLPTMSSSSLFKTLTVANVRLTLSFPLPSSKRSHELHLTWTVLVFFYYRLWNGGPTETNMRHLLSSIITMPVSSSPSPKPKKLSANPSFNHNNSLLCKHSPSATLDILILILVLFSGAFLVTSYFSYIFKSLSLVLPSILHSQSFSLRESPAPYVLGFLLFFAVLIVVLEICYGNRSRKCDNPGCKGLKKAMEFDLQLQTEECLKSASKEIDKLPWKGGTEANPDYECLRSELRKMAPPNGRAVLLFRAKCGCPIAKLEGWGPKRSRRNKKWVLIYMLVPFLCILIGFLFSLTKLYLHCSLTICMHGIPMIVELRNSCQLLNFFSVYLLAKTERVMVIHLFHCTYHCSVSVTHLF